MHPLILNVRECDVNGAAFSKRVLVGIPTLCGGHPRERALGCLQNEEYKNDNRIRKKSKVSDAEQDLFEGCGAYRYRGRGCCVARSCHFQVLVNSVWALCFAGLPNPASNENGFKWV